jgi:predicted branched-subunit amino acid permease
MAIAAFGVLFGTLATSLGSPAIALAASAFVYSGSAQFTMVGLLLAESSLATVLAAVATVNLRNLLLGAVLRPRLRGGWLRRAGVAWFLTDEAFGLALTSERSERTLVVSGAAFYVAWLAGTAVGVLGGRLPALQEAGSAVFPVLFIGLAAMAARTWGTALRAVLAAVITVGGALLWPEARGVIAVLASLAVALPGRS